MKQLFNFNQPLHTSLFLGTIGGMLLIISSRFFDNGYYEILPYPIILILTFILFKPQEAKKFVQLFITGTLTFLTMSCISYLQIIFVENPNVEISSFGHLWRIGMILGMGMLSSLILSSFFMLRKAA